MVVTRRQSVGPAPAVASRTNSSVGTSRSGKGKGVDKTSPLKESGAGPSHPAPNGANSNTPLVGPQILDDIKFDDDPPITPPKSTPSKSTSPKLKQKSKKKASKAKKHHENKGISLFDIIARLFLVWLTIYTLSVCPEDVHHQSPICRALTEYRRVILEPYFYPPIRAALDHPSVAPHIQRVQPYYNHAVQVSTPWVRRGKREWRNRVVPQLQWLRIRTRPYIRRVERQYDATAGPYVRQASTAMARYRLRAEPYVLSAALKTHQAWMTAKPYTIPIWREILRIPGLVTLYVGKPLGDARRQWVDPQVVKIWDAVVEQGKADTSKVKTATRATATTVASTVKSAPPSHSASTYVPSVSAELVNDAPKPTSDSASISLPPVPEPTDEASSSASSVIVKSASMTESSSPITTSTVSVNDIPEPSSESASLAAPLIPEPTDEAAISASSVIRESISPPHSSSDVPVPVPSGISAESSLPAQKPPPPDDQEEFEDLEGFLSELEPPEPEAPPPPPPEETEEERAERERLKAIETAELRANIEGRHEQFEIDIQNLGKANKKVVRSALVVLREEAVQEARAPGGGVRVHAEGLVQEAEKSLKALNAYARKLAGEDKPASEKIRNWEDVVEKVDKKFGDRIDAAADSVRVWWEARTQRELQAVHGIADEVYKVADAAQDSLGMDYAWLPGVTYDDWQRYHRLLDYAKEFRDIYLGMQNGTLPNSPPDPLLDIMETLQEEMDDMILGFETNLSRVKSSVIDSFAPPTEEDPKPSANKPSDSESEPEVSILPIDPTNPKEKVLGVPPVILSRGAEEVESAVSMAEEARTKAAHVEL